MKYVDLNAFDLIAGVFYSRILPLKMAFDTRLPSMRPLESSSFLIST
jgi:hypothetical protein